MIVAIEIMISQKGNKIPVQFKYRISAKILEESKAKILEKIIRNQFNSGW